MADFERFCRMLVWIHTKAGKHETLNFNPIQSRYNAARTWRDIILKPRQIGLSTIEIARDLWKFLQPGERVLLIVQTDANETYIEKFAGEFERMFEGLRRAGLALKFGKESTHKWTLPSIGSSLQIMSAGASVAAAKKKGRSETYSRVHTTESAFYEHPELTLNAVEEAVPNLSNTEIVHESTPNGAGNWFHKKYINAKAKKGPYRAHFFAWFDDPTYRIALEPGEIIEPANDRERELVRRNSLSPTQLKFYQAKIASKGSSDLVEQEYASDEDTCFLKSGRPYFDREALSRAATFVRDPNEHNDGGLRVWARPVPHTRYIISVDPAEGLGPDGNESVAQVWRPGATPEHAATLSNKMMAEEFAPHLIELARQYNEALIVFERNKGMALNSALKLLGYHNIFQDEDDKPGIFTSESSKAMMLSDMRKAQREGSLRSTDIILQTQMGVFVIDPRNGKPHAPDKNKKDGIGDDHIMAAAIGWHVLLRPPPQVEVAFSQPRNFYNEDDAEVSIDQIHELRGW